MTLGEISYTITATTAPLTQKLGEAKQAMGSADNSMKSAGKSISDSTKKMSGTSGGNIGALTGQLGSVSPAAGQAVSGFQKMSMAARAFMGALGPIGLIIMALGAAIAALTAYFKGSVDGQEKMAKIMGTLNGVMTVMKDAAIEVGRWIAWAFENPQEAVKQLWEVIKTNIINRLQGMVEMVVAGWEVISKGAQGVGAAIAGIFDKSRREEAKLLFAEMAEGMKDFGVAAIKAASGIDDIGGKVAGMWDKVTAKASEGSDIAMREIQLRKDQMRAMTDIARLESQIAEARRISNDDTYELTQQITAQEKAMELVDKKMQIQEGLARRALTIQKDKNALGESNLDDLEKAAQLETQLINLTTARDMELRSLLRRMGTLRNEQAAELDSERKKNEEIEAMRAGILEDIRKAGRTEIEVLRETMDEKLAMYEETDQRRMAISAHYNDEIARLEAEAEEEKLSISKSILDRINNDRMSDVERAKAQMAEELSAYGLNEEQKALITEYWTNRIGEIEKQRVDEIGQAWEGLTMIIGGAMAGMATEIGSMVTGAKSDFKSLASSMLNSIGQIINGLLAKAIAGMIAGEASKGLVGLALGAVGVGALKAMWSANVPKMATGGTIPAGYPNDSYPAMLTSGETVIPPKALPQMTGGTLTHRISGQDLLIILNEAQRRNTANY